MKPGRIRIGVAAVLVAVLAAAGYFVIGVSRQAGRIHAVAYFQNSNGVFAGDDVRIRGVTVGTIERIEPEPRRVKISFWFDGKYKVPADAKAVILSPTLDPGLQHRPCHGRGHGHTRGPHRGANGVGRLPCPAPKAHRNAATHSARRSQHTWCAD